jgi:hypothetical protein
MATTTTTSSIGSTLTSFSESIGTDLTTIASITKTGWPTDVNQVNAIVLAALRILSISLVTATTIIGFSATQMTDLAAFTASLPTVVAPALTAIIIFYDLYVGSINITSVMPTITATSAAGAKAKPSILGHKSTPTTGHKGASTTDHKGSSTTSHKTTPTKEVPASTHTSTHKTSPKTNHKDACFKSGKKLSDVLVQGSSAFAAEVTEGMWTSWIWVQTSPHWAPFVAKHFFNTEIAVK